MDNNYQLSRIHNYVAGLMSREDMHALEREAINDPFLQDAIDGYKLQNGVETAPLSLLQKRLAARVQQRNLDRHKRFYSWQRLAVGLVAAVMFVVVCSLLVFRHLHQKPVSSTQAEGITITTSTLRVQVVPEENSDARPLKGWEQFSQKLNENLSSYTNALSVDVKFIIENGHAKDIKISGLSDQRFMEKITQTIRQELRWEGTKAQFRLHIGAE
ncbi:hypothetical protein M8998_12435 [Sphingobacterium sp. lm-10]|uniref:hypothetical protein n=1 Tax=Sphingobacterium sp. lm-10 TaxID=2944904 RepID=UPI002020C141|nr:hypothetical protein [Sphingobacterium sp. lm-10]MCL7988748.1 hypothetical protein [Sphingobacterium sp. lm-10]